MPLLCFKYKPKAVESMIKRQTIRLMRKRPIKVGDKLYMYEKCRTKQMRKIGEHVCTEAFTVDMQYTDDWLHSGKPIWRMDLIRETGGRRQLRPSEIVAIAHLDGFVLAEDMFRWFEKEHGTLHGYRKFQVIRW